MYPGAPGGYPPLYPGQGYPPPGPQPYYPPPPTAPQYPGMPGMMPAPAMLPPHLSAFSQRYDADQTWECKPGDVPKEMSLLDSRKNDMYPQGRDNCMQFLRECQMRGLSFKVKAKKTRPYWTWYYEVNASSYPAPAPMPAPMPAPPMGGVMLPPHLSVFAQHYDADQTWECSPGDVPKEMGLLDSRKNDMYPQGRDNCMQFLRECQMRGYCFQVKAKKTSPYWTWYYQVKGGAMPGMPGMPHIPGPAAFFRMLPPHLMAFSKHYDADQTWECNPGDVPKEMSLLDSRKNDTYPQGRDNCMQFLRECQMRGYRFKVKAKKTRPYWTWYYEINA